MVAASSSRYEIVCRLAGGGMAELFLARITGPGGFERLVVIKRLAEKLAEDPAAMRALFDEARIAATLAHANIVQVHDVDVSGGQVSIVMEYLHGSDVSRLRRRLAQMGELIPLDQALAIVLAVCAGLHHAHEKLGPDGKSLQIVHRDVSPQNVFVTYDGTVKLVDFGIARATTRTDRTAVDVIKGKPGFMAPEQLRARPTDRRTDVWAASVLLYLLTTNKLPFPGIDIKDYVAAASADPAPPSTHRADYPPELEAIVMRGMARDPANRYPTAEALRLALEDFARAARADLSPFRLAALMEHAFQDQLASWKDAQRTGGSLADHVAALRRSSVREVVETVAEPASEDSQATMQLTEKATSGQLERSVEVPAPRSRRRLAIAIGAAAALASGGVWAALASSPSTAATRATAIEPPSIAVKPATAVADDVRPPAPPAISDDVKPIAPAVITEQPIAPAADGVKPIPEKPIAKKRPILHPLVHKAAPPVTPDLDPDAPLPH